MGSNRSYQIYYEANGVRWKKRQLPFIHFTDAEQTLVNEGWSRQVDPIRGTVYYGHKHEPETIALIITLFN